MGIIDRIIYYMGINKIKINDKIYLKLKYKHLMKKQLNLKNPKTYNEKLQWLKLYDRNPLYTKLVDKYEVRDYIEKKFGSEYLIPLLGVYDKFDDINFSKLPKQFVIKCTHDSGGLIVVKDKTKLDVSEARTIINKALKRNYYYSGREWPYKNVKPRIIIEKYMIDAQYNDLLDYKIMCFDGKPTYTFVYSDRLSETGAKATFFDNDWNELNFKRDFLKTNFKIKQPKNFEKMLKFSKIIASNIPFVRVDWYEVNGNLYFGEITFYPSSGFGKFDPDIWDFKLGEMINLSKVKEKYCEK